MKSFTDFEIPQWLKDSLSSIDYKVPTLIQQESIPHALQGKDILGTAQTGTGKTGAFLIPLLNYLHKNPHSTGLILTPTRELAIQVHNVAKSMLKTNNKIKSALLIGGDSIFRQLSQIKKKPRLIIGTPGRVNDHIVRGSFDFNTTSFLVLDETDRMLDMGFGIQIDEILKYVNPKRQTLLFSATLPDEINKFISKYLNDYIRVSSGEVNTVADNVQQELIETNSKNSDLLDLLSTIKETTIIFVRTQRSVDYVTNQLKEKGYKAKGMHGGLTQSKRQHVIKEFRSKKFNILVATDVASRGLDISHISYVINYDMPDNPEDYIHRIGRTARSGREGISYSFVSPTDIDKWNRVQDFLYSKNDKNNQSRKIKPRGSSSKPRKTNKSKYNKDKPIKTNNFRDNSNFVKKRNTVRKDEESVRFSKKDKGINKAKKNRTYSKKIEKMNKKEVKDISDNNLTSSGIEKIKKLFTRSKKAKN